MTSQITDVANGYSEPSSWYTIEAGENRLNVSIALVKIQKNIFRRNELIPATDQNNLLTKSEKSAVTG
jgi:hypothetical protein